HGDLRKGGRLAPRDDVPARSASWPHYAVASPYANGGREQAAWRPSPLRGGWEGSRLLADRQEMGGLQPLPAGPLVAEVEGRRVQDLGEDLQRLDQPRPRPVEVLVAVEQVDPPAAHRPQAVPA